MEASSRAEWPRKQRDIHNHHINSTVWDRFEFRDGDLVLHETVERRSFEEWIEEELDAIANCVDGLLTSSGTAAEDVDAVFLTGGSSFVPAVRRLFQQQFGASKLRSGNEFTSVAMGLARSGAGR
mgnify:CR=1 FL=1